MNAVSLVRAVPGRASTSIRGRRALPRSAAVLILALAALVSPARAAGDVVTDWDATMVEAQGIGATPVPMGTRLGAIVAISVFDAVNGVGEPRYRFIHVPPGAPRHASRAAAAAGAAHEALTAIYPAQGPLFDARLASSLATIHRSKRSIEAGLAWGRAVADEILAWRAADGSATIMPPYVVGTEPGDWQPTPPLYLATPLFRSLSVTVPFGLTSASQFGWPGPPPLTSHRYTAAFDEIKAWGSLASAARSPHDTETALFWGGDSVLALWNRTALQLIGSRHLSLPGEARFLALMNTSMADASIEVWTAKNRFDSWRPITAIQQAATDGNPDTSPDPAWNPLIVTPAFQDYPSGHAGVSGAATGALSALFGPETTFTVVSAGVPDVVRSYDRFSDAIAEIADARTFAGLHFRFDSVDSSRVGGQIGRYIVHTMARPLDDDD